jgi:adenine-specific DNA-methyltransferase
VKDRSDADLTQEPEMIKAFRDTWELGIHSYLTYLRDRLCCWQRNCCSETGSVFVQISDENLHHVRETVDEVFGAYAKSLKNIKYRQLWLDKGVSDVKSYKYKIRTDRQTFKGLSREEKNGADVGADWTIAQFSFAVSQDPGDPAESLYQFHDSSFECGQARHWKTKNPSGLNRLAMSGRLIGLASQLNYIRFLEDFPLSPLTNVWNDTGSAGYSNQDPKRYVVQTDTSVIERCLLMTTDPGDLVLDPTCGGGTTAYVAEKWGRRWITCDTSRVAITLAKQRLMTASFDYYELRYPHEGLKGGFIYKTVPHVTLKSIANNPEID